MSLKSSANATITNAGGAVLTFGRTAGGNGDITIQLDVTKTSGTVAGTATPQMSLDGTNWSAINGASAYTITDVANQSNIWNILDRNADFYRVSITSSGTQVAVAQADLLLSDSD